MSSFKDLFTKFRLTKVKLNLKFAELEYDPKSDDADAAWELCVELLTRVITQGLDSDAGDEKVALDSVHSVFQLTRDILKERGRHAKEFSKIAFIVLNEIIRPFTSKWHRKSLLGELSNPEECKMFRKELSELQTDMRHYAALLADMAGFPELAVIDDDYTDIDEIKGLPPASEAITIAPIYSSEEPEVTIPEEKKA